MKRMTRWIGRGVGGAALAASLLAASVAGAGNDSCREWRHEHRLWKTETLRRYLREAYLTSCETSVAGGHDELVGWRLVGRTPEDYGSAVVESLLDRAGFDLELSGLFGASVSGAAGSGRGIASR